MYRNNIKIQFAIKKLRSMLTSTSFNTLNGAIDYIRSNLEEIGNLDKEIQKELGKDIFRVSSTTGADYDGSAQRATNFMKDIPQNIPPYVALGIFEEMFSVKERVISIKRTYIDFNSLAEVLSANFSKEELEKSFHEAERMQLDDMDFVKKFKESKLSWINLPS